MKTKNQSGFAAIFAFLIAAVVIAVAVFATYRVMSKDDTALSDEFNSVSSKASSGAIKSTKDLQKTAETVDTTNVDSDLDSADLDEDIDAIF